MLTFDTVVDLVENFPKPGVKFADMGRLLANVKLRNQVLDYFADKVGEMQIDVVAGLDSRGFIFGAALADRLGLPFAMIRKSGKLPPPVVKVEYKLEYGTDVFEVQLGKIKPKDRVVLVDDILATGGSLLAAAQLVESLEAKLEGFVVLGCVCDEGLDAIFSKYPRQPLIMLPTQPRQVVPYFPPPHSASTVILFHDAMETTARRIYNSNSDICDLRRIVWSKFPDGTPHLKIPTGLKHKRVVFLASMYRIEEWLAQLSVMMILGRQNIQSLDIVLPYFAPGTMERVENVRDVATADTFAQISSACMSPTREGPPVIWTFDLHAPVSRFCFDSNKVRFMPLTASHLIMDRMDLMVGKNNYVIAFPDEGSWKRFRSYVHEKNPDQPYVVFSKIRSGDERKVQIVETSQLSPDSYLHVLIMDDLVQTGGTLDECRRALVAMGVKSVSAFTTHAVFPDRSYRHFLPGGKFEGFANFWVTDSNPQVTDQLIDLEPFRVLPLSHEMELAAVSNSLKFMFSCDLASNSPVKARAAESVFKTLSHANVTVRKTDTISGVSSQPVGYDETLLGAMNRLKQCKDVPRVAMENGITFKDGVWYDFALVAFQESRYAAVVVRETRKVQVDTRLVEKALVEKKTVGEAYAEKFGYDANDWHLQVCGMSRAFLLAEALFACFAHVPQRYSTVAFLPKNVSGSEFLRVCSSEKNPKLEFDVRPGRDGVLCVFIHSNTSDVIPWMANRVKSLGFETVVCAETAQAVEEARRMYLKFDV